MERSIRPIALNRKNALFAGSDGGGEHWAILASLIETCKLNRVDPQSYLADVLTRLLAARPGVEAHGGITADALHTDLQPELAAGMRAYLAQLALHSVERLIVTEHLSPKEAARKSMDEISSALVGIGLVLSAVFLPMAFFGGSTGVIYRQFSITIVSAMVLSVLVALILTPALCATILKPHDPHKHEQGNGPLARFFRWFNDRFERSQHKYENGVRRTTRSWKRSMVVYLLIVLGMVFVFTRLPSGFLPDEDQGTVLALVQGPAAATSSRVIGFICALLRRRMDHHCSEEH